MQSTNKHFTVGIDAPQLPHKLTLMLATRCHEIMLTPMNQRGETKLPRERVADVRGLLAVEIEHV